MTEGLVEPTEAERFLGAAQALAETRRADAALLNVAARPEALGGPLPTGILDSAQADRGGRDQYPSGIVAVAATSPAAASA